jgi:glycine amidinotransferase
MIAEAELKKDVATCVVNSFNEWDPLEEVIVGILDGASVPPWHVTLKATMPRNSWSFFQQHGGQPFPKEQIEAGSKDLEEFVHILEAEGVRVRRPEALDFCQPYRAGGWECAGGLYSAMPRDLLLVIGNEIIECPMAWRSRYFEVHSYRQLLKEYFQAGAKWTAAPRPQLSDELYDYDYANVEDEDLETQPLKYVINEFEPTFDAADFSRCGKDIFVQKSHVTNSFGINWLRRHLEGEYRIHELSFKDSHPMHIDATFVPLAPGKLLVNPERVGQLPDIFKTWDIFTPPAPVIPDSHPLYMTSKWITINLLMLDQERVIVEKNEQPLIRALKDWGFKPIPCSFRHFNTFGGSFHCATLDVRRKGQLQSYF